MHYVVDIALIKKKNDNIVYLILYIVICSTTEYVRSGMVVINKNTSFAYILSNNLY